MKRYIMIIVVAALAIVPASGRAFDLGQAIGSAIEGGKQLAEASKEITPSEEHYIGRAVAAMVLAKYPLLENIALTRYINEVGLLLAAASDRPNTYGGYHFAVLNSDVPNAFACPGGIILINKGLLKEVQNEDQLAGVLAHEVAHVAHRHGIGAIKKSRWTKLGFYAAGEVGKQYSSSEIGQLVGEFQGVVTDVAKNVMESGYSKSDEKFADEAAVRFAYAAGYNPNELVNFVKSEESKGIGSDQGPFASHPKPEARLKGIEGTIAGESGASSAATEAARTARFKAAMAVVR